MNDATRSTAPGRVAGACKVLLVDDEPAIARPMADYLGQLGWATDVACEPEEAGALATYRRYDLAILDLSLTPWGGGEGLEVLRELREHCPGAVILILSAHVSAEAEAEAMRCGADAVLRKPQPLPELTRLARRLMDDPRA